ncbi:MAG: ABC transporter substrate-binding protein, partial [Candidatus Ventricola sp.]
MKKSIVSLFLAVCLCLGMAACAGAEGKVTVYMPSPAGLADKLAAAFTEKTGIEVEQFQGTTG